jgi:uncharacterized protein (TIGR02145 family)
MKNVFKISGVILIIFLSHSCKKEKYTPQAEITTKDVTEISYTTATSGGDLIKIDGASIISTGVCWNTSPVPTIDNTKTTESGYLGEFTSKMTQLTPNTKYYVRAYAVSSDVTGYGNEVSFTTLQVAIPVLITTEITSITLTTATCGGIVSSDGGASVTARGVCWSTSANPTTANSITTDGTGTGAFTSSITGLTAGTIYYVRSYATSSVGTGYGNEVSFVTTSATEPAISTTAVTSITGTTATSGGNVTSDGGATVTAYGVCWNTSVNPTTANSTTTDGAGTGAFTSSITGLTPGTLYYVRAYATNSIGTTYGNEISFTTAAALPTLTTTAATSITETTATSGGDITSSGGASVTARGVCWSTSATPTTADSKTTDGSGTGTFTSSITGLTAGTLYYVRAYAINSAGTGYGSAVSFTTQQGGVGNVTDDDGNVYHSVTIGTQVWMVENLKSTKFNDGTSIPLVTDATEWQNLSTPAYCWTNNDAATYKATYGALYNWYTVNTGNLCPGGWHVPGDAEWTTLTTYLGGEDVAGGKLKEAGTTHWMNPNEEATNESGFTALPGGERLFNGTFPGTGAGGYWWSSTEHSASFGWYRFMYYLLGYVDRDYESKESGLSVRCIKD